MYILRQTYNVCLDTKQLRKILIILVFSYMLFPVHVCDGNTIYTKKFLFVHAAFNLTIKKKTCVLKSIEKFHKYCKILNVILVYSSLPILKKGRKTASENP